MSRLFVGTYRVLIYIAPRAAGALPLPRARLLPFFVLVFCSVAAYEYYDCFFCRVFYLVNYPLNDLLPQPAHFFLFFSFLFFPFLSFSLPNYC